MTLPAHQQRVIEERDQLENRINKLDAFLETALFSQLEDTDQTLLRNQLATMLPYLEVLNLRIARFSQG